MPKPHGRNWSLIAGRASVAALGLLVLVPLGATGLWMPVIPLTGLCALAWLGFEEAGR